MTTTIKTRIKTRANVATLGEWDLVDDFVPTNTVDPTGAALFEVRFWYDDEYGHPRFQRAFVAYGPDIPAPELEDDCPF
jgi:hypothetical protein